MGKLVVSLDNVVIKEFQITKERTTLGRRPYNDIVIDNLAVSGEHAVLTASQTDVLIEDLNSTNGTYINGKAVKKQLLHADDNIEIGKYKIKFLSEVAAGYEKTMVVRPPVSSQASSPGLHADVPVNASIKVLSGVATGREVALVKVVTTIGKPGIAIAAITRRPNGFVISHVEGASRPTINGIAVGSDELSLKSGDVIELAGTQMQFITR